MKAIGIFLLTGGLIAGTVGLPVNVAVAQSFTTLHSFSALSGATNGDGSTAFAALVLSSNTLYGTTPAGGATGHGVVFKVNTNGTGFTTLHSFTGGTNEGSSPYSELTLSGGTLYGTTDTGGAANAGTVFRVNIDGTGFTNLYSFSSLSFPTGTNTDGAFPYAGLVIAGNSLFGTTTSGGTASFGVIFRINLDGGGFTNLHSFVNTTNGPVDGITPEASLIVSGGTLYGVASGGGPDGSGVIFSINTNGTSFVNLHHFNSASEGGYAISALVLAGTTLYGSTPSGGTSNYGTIFSLSTDGSHFTNLHNFIGGTNGASSQAGLALYGNTLYGSTSGGGSASNGIIFSILTNGTGFSNLYNFTALTNNTNSGGIQPLRSLVLSSNVAFGTASGGGAFGNGTVFEITLPPQTNGHPAFFAGEIALNGGAYYYLTFPNSNIFGFYNYQYFPYLYHYNMGFEYFIDANDGAGGAYLYDFTSGHFWYTSPSYGFPYIYDFSLNAALYYYPDPNNPGQYSSNPRSFYNFATGHVIYQ